MSQIEQNIREFFARKPEIEKCVQEGLINRRSLARYLIKQRIAEDHQLEAVIATLRRYAFREFKKEELKVFKEVTVRVKDNICLLDFEKEKDLLKELRSIIDQTDYDKGETLKIVVGTSSLSLFLDDDNKELIKTLTRKYKLKKKTVNISELSILFPEKAIETKGVLAFLTKELYNNDILVNELLTASSEVIIYLDEQYVLKAYELVKRLGK
ncbi:hypothetical protein J4410_06650 [Candidatus Woesearchaeota archaeon]|nr:hypothetical protein [Candidatus Woesearchaeota archaeon]